ncbi:MAG: pyruvate, water dikinase regulatory protein [bacterium]|jgi:regulator of PEP synthase PpsR (kinase-PPPase family)
MGDAVYPMVFVVSDSVGETAEFVVRAAASQFNSGYLEIKRIPYTGTEEQIAEAVAKAAETNSIVAYTLVLPELRVAMEKEGRRQGVVTVDILGPILDALTLKVSADPKLQPGLVHKIDEDYFRRVEAVEFAVKYDDGKDPRGLLRADLTLIGVSRTSKTPLSMYLAHKRLKVANIPLVPEIQPPEELFKLPPFRVIGLTIGPEQLHEIRQERLRTMGLTATAEYASVERILHELEYAEGIMRRIGCPVIEVTNKAVEETAGKILEIISRRERNE